MVPVREARKKGRARGDSRPETGASGEKRPWRDYGVAQLQRRRLRDLLGETQIPLPRLPCALVSAGVVRKGTGRGGGGPGGDPGRVRATSRANAARGLCCYSCSVTCFRKHKGKAPESPRAPEPPLFSRRQPSRPAASLPALPPSILSEPQGESLPVNASRDSDQSETSAIPFPPETATPLSPQKWVTALAAKVNPSVFFLVFSKAALAAVNKNNFFFFKCLARNNEVDLFTLRGG